MRFIKIFLASTLMLISWQAGAQGFVENALLFSRNRPGGSARIQGMGGAQVALGGDYSSAVSNPAGLGMYNRSEFTFSPALNFYNSSSSHLGSGMNDSKTILNIPGISYVRNFPQERGKFLGGSFGVSYTRTNDFQNAFQYGATTSNASVIDYFIQDATGFDGSSFGDGTFGGDIRTQLGYDNFLIEDSSSLGGSPMEYYSVLSPDDASETRTYQRYGNVDMRGAQYQLSFAYGANINDELYLGASLGVSSIRYRFKSTYRESNFNFDLEPNYRPLDYLQMEETIDVTGRGVNLTLGMIYRPASFIQVGASLVTPTFYGLTDTYTATLQTQWNDFDYFGTADPNDDLNSESSSAEPIVSDYNITTPMKFSTGVAFFLGKYGFVTGDVEFINYSKTKYSSNTPDVSFAPENDDIRSSFGSAINTRIGAELRYDIFRIRGGYGLQANPYNTGVSSTDFKQTTLSAGAGVRFENFYIDAAWIQTKGNSTFSVFGFSNNTGPVVSLNNTLTSAMLTLGFTF